MKKPDPEATSPGRWEHFSHAADVGVRGIGSTLAEAFAQAARAVTAAVLDPDRLKCRTPVEIACEGKDVEDLLYVWLNCVIYEMATRHMLFGRFEVSIENLHLEARAWGEEASRRQQPAVEVKGATFTALSVRHVGSQWIAECVIDV